MKTISLPDALADALVSALGGQAVAEVDYTQVWDPPRLITVGGVNILAVAPINPKWSPGTTASAFSGSLGDSVAALHDPSLIGQANGKDKPYRSPAGFPMFWPPNSDVGYVYHRGACFPDDASVLEDIKKSEAAQVGAKEKWDATTAKIGKQGQQV